MALSRVTRLEVGYSARSASDLGRVVSSAPLAAMPVEYLPPAIEDRAVEVQWRLAERGLHHGPSIPDLLIAATAEFSGRTVLHLEEDFDMIVEITGQRVERLALED